jgi:hypothetical protein
MSNDFTVNFHFSPQIIFFIIRCTLEHSQREVHRIFRDVTSTPDRGPLLRSPVRDSWHPQRQPPEISK